MNRWLLEEKIKPIHWSLFQTISKNGKKTAIDFFGRKFSYEELGSNIKQFSVMYDSLTADDHNGQRVAIFTPNIPQFVFAYYGALLSDMVAVPINFSSVARELKTQKPQDIKISEEITAQIEDSKPTIIIVADIFWPILNQISHLLRGSIVLVTGIDEFLPFPLNKLYRIKNHIQGKNVTVQYKENMYPLRAMLGDPREAPLQKLGDINGAAQILYTGGTTGVPKGAVLTHKNVMTNVLQCREHIGDLIGSEQKVLGVLPFFHSYGLTAAMHMALLALEGTLVLVPSFDAKDCLKLIQKKKLTMFPGVNRMFQVILDYKELSLLHKIIFGLLTLCAKLLCSKPLGKKLLSRIENAKEKAKKPVDIRFPSLELCISGAGPLDLAVKEKFEQATGSRIVEGYGLTETSPVVSVTLPNENKPGSCGRALPLTEVRIVDTETGVPLAAGLEGEITVRGPQVMTGYYKKPEATKDMIRDGWLFTGDIGRIDKDGFIYITDRKKDMFTVGGENVFCKNIEDYFRDHPAVAKCAVIGVKNAKMGEAPVLVVVMKSGHDVSEIYQHARIIPNKFWNPVDIVAVDEKQFMEWEDILGKLKRRKIRDWYKQNEKK
jgi:long-chain acyl-CoA synthetase